MTPIKQHIHTIKDAAPELLDALEWLVSCADPNGDKSEMRDGGLKDLEHAIDRARAAIRKSTRG